MHAKTSNAIRITTSCLAMLAVAACWGGSDDADEAEGEPPVTAQIAAPAPNTTAPGSDTPVTAGGTKADPADRPARKDASRFLVQASFGGSEADMLAVEELGFEGWITRQAALPVRSMTDRILQTPDAERHHLIDLFWNYALENDDQLRQRVAYALSQIVVVSADHEHATDAPEAYTRYLDILQEEALGNYADLVRRVTMTPIMGSYLSVTGNRKHDPATGVRPDENFARELMQLFTIGLDELSMDGTPTGRPTYDNEDVVGLAAVFTGLSWAGTDFRWPDTNEADTLSDMVGYPRFHENGEKSFLDATIPASLDAETSVDRALDHLLAHRNLAPFVTKQLIQRLVTSNPSPAYVLRVATAFERGRFALPSGASVGTGRRGDLMATVAAILLDDEARSQDHAAATDFGRAREPILRFAQVARAFRDDQGAPRRGPPVFTGPLRWSERQGLLGQKALSPPSVFGFTRPGYVAPATWSGEAELVAPGLSLAGGSRAVGFLEFMAEVSQNGVWAGEFFALDLERDLLPLAGDPEALAARLDEVLTYGTMSAETSERIAQAVRTVKIEGDGATRARKARNRVSLAVFMAATSPAFNVQR